MTPGRGAATGALFNGSAIPLGVLVALLCAIAPAQAVASDSGSNAADSGHETDSTGTESATSPLPAPTGAGDGAILIGPPSAHYGELGELVEHRITVTNNVTRPVLADLSWNAPPPEWSVGAFDVEGSPLPDMNLNGMPDVSLGQVRSGTESVTVVMEVQVPTAVPPQLEIKTTVVAQVPNTNDSAAVGLLSGIGPWVTLDRSVNPDIVNIRNSGGVEMTTVTLTVRGEGVVVRQPVPIDVVFEVDRSGSMGWSDPMNLRVDAVQLYIDRMTPADRGSVIGFEEFAWVVNNRPLTTTDAPGRAILKADVDTLRGAGGGTNLDAALQLGTDWLITYGDPMKKRIEILLTDGIGSTQNTDNILDQAIRERIVIYTVGLGDSIDEAYLRRVADRTGGEYFHADSASQLAELYERLANRTIDTAARDPDPTDFDPMVVDVLPPFIHYVFASALDPETGVPRPPLLDGVDGAGNRVLGWNVASLSVNETWRVSFLVTSSRGGLVPTNVYGLSRVAFEDFRGRSRTLLFPEIPITVLAPPPETSITVGMPRVVGAATYVTSATPLSFFSLDRSATGIRTTSFRVDGSEWIDLTGGGTFSLWLEGEHIVEWFSEDNIGNVEAVKGATFRVDNSPPLSALLVGTPKVESGLVFLTAATPLSLDAADDGVTPVGLEGIEVRIDGSPWGLYYGSFHLLSDGTHTIGYRARDLLGNAEPGHTATLYVDGMGPIFRVAAGTPAYVAADTWVTSHTEIVLEAADRGSPSVGLESFEYRILFDVWSEWKAYEGPLALSPEGRHAIEMRAVDRLGNEGSASASFIVDDTPPVLTTSVGTPKAVRGDLFATSETPISLSVTEGGPIPVGIEYFEYRIDGGDWSPYGGAVRLQEEGHHVLDYRASDRLGNSAAGAMTVIVDNTPPVLGLEVGTPRHVADATWITSSSPIEIAAADGGLVPVGLETAEYREWSGAWTPWRPLPGLARLSGEGLHSLQVRAMDGLGHAAAIETDVIVDDSPPELALTIGLPMLERETIFLTSATPLALHAADRGVLPVGLRDTEYLLEGTWHRNLGSLRITGHDGARTLEYRATDLLGHATRGAVDLVLDNTPPETLVAPSFDPQSKSATLELNAADGGSGVASTEFRLNAAGRKAYGGRLTLEVGRHVIVYQSADLLGNVEEEKVYAIVIPAEGPHVLTNWTPSLAFTFAVVLIGVGFGMSRRQRARGAVPLQAASVGAVSVPFVGAALATGLLSLHMEQLRMPPALGWALFVLIAVLVSGLLVVWLRARSYEPQAPEDSATLGPLEGPAPPPPDDLQDASRSEAP